MCVNFCCFFVFQTEKRRNMFRQTREEKEEDIRTLKLLRHLVLHHDIYSRRYILATHIYTFIFTLVKYMVIIMFYPMCTDILPCLCLIGMCMWWSHAQELCFSGKVLFMTISLKCGRCIWLKMLPSLIDAKRPGGMTGRDTSLKLPHMEHETIITQII